MGDQQYRTGTSTIALSADLNPAELRDGIGEALRAELARTGEWLERFDYGPPHRAAEPGQHSFDVMYRTGPSTGGDVGPGLQQEPPQVGA